MLRILGADGQSLLVGPIICSESLHAQHVIEGARKDSQLIINIGLSIGPKRDPFHIEDTEWEDALAKIARKIEVAHSPDLPPPYAKMAGTGTARRRVRPEDNHAVWVLRRDAGYLFVDVKN